MVAPRHRRRSPTSSSPSSSSASSSTPSSTARSARSGGRLGDRAGPQPQAVLRRRDAGGSAPRAGPAARRPAARRLVIGLPLYWIFEPARQRGAVGARGGDVRRLRGAAVRARPPTRVQLRRLPRRHERHRRRGAVHGHRPDHRRGAGRRLAGAGAEHGVLPLLARRGPVHPQYGRPGSPMSAWGLEGGGPMNFQQIDTLLDYIESIQIPREDCIARRRATRCARAATCRPTSRPTSSRRLASRSRTASTPRTARRCSTSS